MKNKIAETRKQMLKCIERIEKSKAGSSIERIYINQYDELKKILETLENSKTMLIGENWYYWNESKKQWLPESYKFEETKVNKLT